MQFTPFYKHVTGILFYSNILQNDSISIRNMMETASFLSQSPFVSRNLHFSCSIVLFFAAFCLKMSFSTNQQNEIYPIFIDTKNIFL